MKTLIAFILVVISFQSNADWSLVGGVGQANFKWCDDDGCWHQNPLPYTDDRSGGAAIVGVRYEINKNLSIDGLYHALPTAKVSGTYVPDDDYNPKTFEVTPGAYVYQTAMNVRTYGLSLSLVPKINFGDTSVFGRLGVLKYHQTIEFTHPGEDYAYLKESGSNYTPMVGFGVGHTFGNVTFAVEAIGFQRVKYGQSPVGGYWMGDKYSIGLVEYLFTISYKL